MKHYIWLIWTLCILGLSSCSKEADFYSDNEQDRDGDVITGDDYVYHLPVIFHVLYQDADATNASGNKSQYIPYSHLKALLDNVNDLYEGALYSLNTQEGASENIHVKFEMALYDENNKKLSTPGVEYIHYNGEYPIDCDTFMKAKKKKGKIIWDPNEYINIMVYNFKNTQTNTITLGISNMPYKANGLPELEGLEDGGSSSIMSKSNLSFEYCLSLNSCFIYDESTRYTDPAHGSGKDGYKYISTDANVTLAHELGHYLGLHHVFSEQKGDNGLEPADNCNDTDYCTDTKSYNKLAYDNWKSTYLQAHEEKKDYDMKELIKRNNDQGDTWNSDNFMDYAISLSYRFTPEQKERMRQVLYYSPLIPGPKKNRNFDKQTRANDDKIIDLPICLAVDKIPLSSTDITSE